MSKEQRPVAFRPEYFDIVQDINAALLMSQIHYWYMPDKNGGSKLKVYRNGSFWLAKSHDEWFQECRLSRRQVDRALQRLEAEGLIRVEVFRFGGAPTRHIICDVLAQIPLSHRASIALLGAFDCTAKGNGTHQQVQSLTETTAGDYSESTPAMPDPASLNQSQSSASPESQAEEKEKILEKEVNAKEILESLNKKKTETKAVTGINELVLLWRKKMGLLDSGYQKPLTGKETGQLKTVMKAIGPEKAGQALSYALDHWAKFSQEAMFQKGAPVVTTPGCGYFCQHYDVAVRLLEASTKKAAPKPLPVAVAAPVAAPVAVAAPVEELASDEEIQATLEMLESLKKGK